MERWRRLGVEPVKIMRRRALFLRGRSLCLKVWDIKKGIRVEKMCWVPDKEGQKVNQVERLGRDKSQ